jgi:hypothetical protein
MGEWRHRSRGASTVHQLFYERLADPEEVSNRTLGAQAGIAGAQTLVSEI